MSPTPEQMAFAFAMIRAREEASSYNDNPGRELRSPWLRSAIRVATVTLILASGVIAADSYLHATWAKPVLSEEDWATIALPSPQYEEAVRAGTFEDDEPPAASASVNP